MGEQIDGVLYKAGITANGYAATTHTPLDALLANESADDEDLAAARNEGRNEAMGKLLEYFFSEGPEPLALLRRMYAVAKAVRPHLLADMSLEDIALLSGDGGRATVSARIGRVYNLFIEQRGGGKVKAAFQKSATACGKYSEVQKGNKNRKIGAMKAARKTAKTKPQTTLKNKKKP